MPSILTVGSKAPDFKLKDEQGQTMHLAEILTKRPVVLVFYPGDMTPGCTIQLCGIRDHWEKFKKLDAAVYGINHAHAESHQNFIKKYSFPFPLLIDADKAVSKKYDALKKIFSATVIKRTVVVINKEGVITFIKTGMPKETEILKAIK